MSSFQIFTPAERDLLRTGGKILRACLNETAARVAPGMRTDALDRFAEDFIRSHNGARPAFKGYHNFPATLCTSINDQCVHGIPGPRVLKDGDIVSIDCGVIYGDLYTDSCISVAVGTVSPEVHRFLAVSVDALTQACSAVKPGARVGDISSTIQRIVEGGGYSCVNGLTGHGVGNTLHQFPDVPNTGKRGMGPVLPLWTAIAIEPITSMGGPQIVEDSDGWTICTRDGSLSAHYEHTVLVTEEGMEIIA